MYLHPGTGDDELSCSLGKESFDVWYKREYHNIMPLDYTAVSYVWGNLDRSHRMKCNETETIPVKLVPELELKIPARFCPARFKESIKITDNLRTLLFHLREPEGYPAFWIDAISINQDDVNERNYQVQLMTEIYHRASHVIVWLGESDEKTIDAFQAIRRFAAMLVKESGVTSTWENQADEKHGFRPWRLSSNDSSFVSVQACRAFGELLKRPWFQRTWTFQEAAQASKVTVRCGHQEVDWNELYDACCAVKQLDIKIDDYNSTNVQPVISIGDCRNIIVEYRNIVLSASQSTAQTRNNSETYRPIVTKAYKTLYFGNLLCVVRNRHSTDLRDKVYAILGMSLGGRGFEPDYSLTVRDVYIQAARQSLVKDGATNLSILSYVQDFKETFQLPSWVPDWSIPFSLRPICDLVELDASLNRDGVAEVIYDHHQSCVTNPQSQQESLFAGPCLRVQGVRIMRIRETSNCKLAGCYTALLGRFPGLYPTSNQTYGELFPIVTNPLQPEELRMNKNHRRTTFWENNEEIEENPSLETAMPQTHPRYISKDLEALVLHRTRLSRLVCHEVPVAHGRLLFISTSGFMGLVPPKAIPGDEIALIFGANVPFVVRKQSDHYQFIGECYVYGIMDGEALEGLDESTVEDLVFC